MPKARLQKVVMLPNNELFISYRPCMLLAEKDKFILFDVETDSVLITSTTRNFLENEIKMGRLKIDDSAWPQVEPDKIC